MAKAKTKAVGTNLRVPQSDAEAEQMIAQLGASQRDQVEAQTRHDASVAVLEEAHAKALTGFQDTQTGLIEGLSIWATANRDRLTSNGKSKTVQMVSGKLLWRDGKHSVKHRPLKVDDVISNVTEQIAVYTADIAIARQEKRGAKAIATLRIHLTTLKSFLRTKVELNKEAMLAAREVAGTIPGVSVPRGAEEFVVEPLASQISEVASANA